MQYCPVQTLLLFSLGLWLLFLLALLISFKIKTIRLLNTVASHAEEINGTQSTSVNCVDLNNGCKYRGTTTMWRFLPTEGQAWK